MKCILIISAVYPPEPIVSAKLSSDLFCELKKEGRAVMALHPSPTRPKGFKFDSAYKESDGEIVVDSYTCPQSSLIGRFLESYSFGKACSKYIKTHYKEICAIYANVWPVCSQYMIVKVAKKYGIPVVLHVQDVYPESLTNKYPSFVGRIFNSLLLPYDKFILRNSTKVVAISEKMKNYLVLSRGIDENKISVVINWQDESEFLEFQEHNEQSPHEKFTFMYMGNMGPVAGVDLLIDAFNRVDNPRLKLVIAGSGSMKESLKEKAKSNIKIEFWDVPNGKVPEIQAKADVMLLPIKKGASSSSIPSKLPAYMFSAKPIIGCMDEDCDTAIAIRESKSGYVIEPENVDALSKMMKRLLNTDSNILKGMGLMGKKYALNKFSKDANLRNLTRVLYDIIV